MEGDRDGKSSLRRIFRVSAEDTWEEIPVGQARPLSGVRAGLVPFKFPFLIVRQRWGKEHAVMEHRWWALLCLTEETSVLIT